MIGAVLVAAAVLAQRAPAAAPPDSAPAAAGHGVSGVTVTGPKHRADDPNEIVCRKEQVLGTLFPKETCWRREDLVERQRIDQTETRHAHEHAQIEVLNPADKR